jgi:glycosyltransferase involved in cell wall biosynthesis
VRIAFTTDYFPPHIGGGVEVVVSEVATRAAAAGHDVLVATLGRDDWAATEVRDDVRIFRFPSIRLDRLTGLELTMSLPALVGMRRLLEDFAPDVVNAHHQYFTTTPAALGATRRLGIPSVLTLHIATLDSFRGWRGQVARLYGSTMGKSLIARADALVAVSEAVARSANTRLNQMVRVIPNGVDNGRFYPGPAREPGSRAVFVGRLIANKGPDVAIDAFRIVRERIAGATLTMVGDGPMADALRRQVGEAGLEDAVIFLGMRDDVDEILRQSDVFVRPSQVEGMPLTILEAMATGLPVVACDVGGVAEIVRSGVTGHVVPPGSVAAVADAILDVLGNPRRAAEMGTEARREIQEGFSWDATAASNMELFAELVRGRSG